ITARLFGLNQRGASNVGLTVLGRGEFSLILATLALAAGLDERIGPFVALYVLILAILAPILAVNSRMLARFIPDRLLHDRWRYVREETISTACTHMDRIQITETDTDVCTQCVESGDTWVELRMCLTCGEVTCCSDSPNKHADEHFADTEHPIIRSLEHDDGWEYCYADGALIREPAGATAQPSN
ncbi:MAG TPA: UBP-type zinc finger domain-containing protein, partial [Actinoplanes sp.]|nr:UBP-type zinc finger domain-containing protein [Actinoplanes sp.]